MSEIEEMVEEAKKPGVFKITDALKDRAYPSTEIEVFLDEQTAFAASELDAELSRIAESMDKSKALVKKEVDRITKLRDDIMSKKEKLVEEMGGTRYVFHIKGISEGQRQDIYDKAVSEYPIKYEKSRNPLTGQNEKTEIENEERDRYFTTLLWQAYIVKIVAPDGSEQVGINYDEAVELRRSLPLASISKITDSIERTRVATAMFMMSVNEDFLAKS